ncbi:hypothetical protein BST63_03225 [Bradyrhizobium canariense]|uniref:Cytochrome c domain-containing protein n=1 Tax=Bradyrhizobium canariense TaxID=255045 RepID=A0ABX3XAD1_9BRAD|nr:di-heme-cytochrome C peroxidase [Bradyrhizobium canariense]OSJ19304.1 hypothetical protein BSR47_03590 [Bradyrhizobium canariense]OSJ34687.1 hypothetical protein BST63_03225 [Bradyrhizobium canariense]
MRCRFRGYHRSAVVLSIFFYLEFIGTVIAADPVPIDQGAEWTSTRRNDFYTLDQGSRLIPLSWIMALKLPDGRPFMDHGLQRYGFLKNGTATLPLGFTSTGQAGREILGLTCSACHTRQIEVSGTSYRIDGGPALIDFQKFLSDLDVAVDKLVNDANAFTTFAESILGTPHSALEEVALYQAVSTWHYRYHAQMERSLPRSKPWGVGRLDAIAMIFNRLTGLDLGPPPGHLIRENIKSAVAPVRYPFLWNAHKQDKTQWPGFAPNFIPELRLARNLGQVYGVFADFAPRKDAASPTGDGIDYLTNNSANLAGLRSLDTITTFIGPPRWPWAIDSTLKSQGEVIFVRECQGCHGSGKDAPPWKTQITPIAKIQSDYAELDLLKRNALSGVLKGSTMVPDGPLNEEDTALRILTASVIGALVQEQQYAFAAKDPNTIKAKFGKLFTGQDEPGYEARVLDGIWASAPYLHNGTVPTLTELLKPAAARIPIFAVGSSYDPATLGLAAAQPQPSTIVTTTGCDDRGSGNSRCGHEYGTALSEAEKKALLEYLKSL